MKPTTFKSEKERILRGIYNHDIRLDDGINMLNSLLQTTIRECMPKEKDYIHPYEVNTYEVGWNECLDTITKNLREKGLVSK